MIYKGIVLNLGLTTDRAAIPRSERSSDSNLELENGIVWRRIAESNFGLR